MKGGLGDKISQIFWSCTLSRIFSQKFAFKSFPRTSKALFRILDFQNLAGGPDISLTTRPVCNDGLLNILD